MLYSFEKLEVWQKSRLLVRSIYNITQNFPPDEKYGMTSQLRRASVSVSSNIAEGSVRWSKKEQARFYEISYGSLIEVLNQLILSHDLEFLDDKELIALRKQIDETGRMINSLYYSAKNKSA